MNNSTKIILTISALLILATTIWAIASSRQTDSPGGVLLDPSIQIAPSPTPSPTPTPTPTPPPQSATNLQLALFAHMAFMPFDFNAGETPVSQGFTPMHYQPFYELVMTANSQGQNYYGFNFAYEMQNWQLSQIHTNPHTGFKAVIYQSPDTRTIILSIRGTYGGLSDALLDQTGPWWCNFRSMAGYRHSHIYDLIDLINSPEIISKFSDAHIYITGHSLGGYLAYIATYHLAGMGFEDNIQRVVAFSAPILNQETITKISSLSPGLRSRMLHYYVQGDLIAGAIGIKMEGTVPDIGAFRLLIRLFDTIYATHQIAIPQGLITMTNIFINVERLFTLGVPDHMHELIWRLEGAMSKEALALTNYFSGLITHTQIPQTWHTERPEPPWPVDASVITILRNFSQDAAIEMSAYMMLEIFDVDTHFMMNFYEFLVDNT